LTVSLPLKKSIKAALRSFFVLSTSFLILSTSFQISIEHHLTSKFQSQTVSTKAIMQFTPLLTTAILALSAIAAPSIKERQSVAATGTLWTTGGCSGAASTSGFEIPTGGCTAFPAGTESGEFSGIVFGCTRT
jgi:hypothetical protein